MNPSKPLPTTWLTRWEPEDPQFWEAQGKVLAWRTLWITTFNLTLAFITWFVVSAWSCAYPTWVFS